MQNPETEQVHDLDKDFKPSGRPQSTVARNFAASLDDLFKMEHSDLESISKTVTEKKQAVATQNAELEALEARLKETEERLKKAGSSKTAANDADATPEQTAKSMPGAIPDTPQSQNRDPFSTS